MALGPGFWTTFFYYFATTLIIASVTAGQALHVAPLNPIAIQLGLVLGGLAGFGGAFFNRSVIWEVPVQGRKAFFNRLDQALEEIKFGFLEEDELPVLDSDNASLTDSSKGQPTLLRTYGPAGAGAFFAGRLYVRLQGKQAELMGRAATIKRLKTLL